MSTAVEAAYELPPAQAVPPGTAWQPPEPVQGASDRLRSRTDRNQEPPGRASTPTHPCAAALPDEPLSAAAGWSSARRITAAPTICAGVAQRAAAGGLCVGRATEGQEEGRHAQSHDCVQVRERLGSSTAPDKGPALCRRRRRRPATVIVSRLLPPSCCRPSSSHFLLCCRAPSLEGASLRAEAEAPFRGFRLFIFGAGAVGAGLATLFGLPSLIGALGGAPGATKTTAEALQDFGINVGSFAALAFLVQRDLQVGGRLSWALAGGGVPVHSGLLLLESAWLTDVRPPLQLQPCASLPLCQPIPSGRGACGCWAAALLSSAVSPPLCAGA